MANTKNTVTKDESLSAPFTLTLPTEKRIEFLASLIIDRIQDDMKRGRPLLKKLKVE